MSEFIYTIMQDQMGVDYVHAVNGDVILIIPMDPANADYQAYLNRNNPDYGKPTQL